MDEKYYGGFNTWGIAIFLIILFAAFLGNRGGWNNNGAAPAYGCNAVSNCQVEKHAKFNAVEAQLASISCRMLPKPDVTGIGAVCPNAGIINGLGINSLNGGCNMV